MSVHTETGVCLSPKSSCVARVGGGGHCVERGQQMFDISCRPAGLSGGQQLWIILTFPASGDWQPGVGLQQKEAVGEAGAERRL